MSRYTEPFENGDKHYVVEVSDWGRVSERLVVAQSPSEARYEAVGRAPHEYAVKTRRATPEDLNRLGDSL